MKYLDINKCIFLKNIEQLDNIIPAAKSYVKYQMEINANGPIYKKTILEDLDDDMIVYPVITETFSPLIVSPQKDGSDLSNNLKDK